MAMHERPARTDGAPLTADQIERQSFARARKGFDEEGVRGFLHNVAREFEALTRRIAQLEEQLRQLEEQLRHPRLPSEQQLVDLVSEEVARTLHSAQESADELTKRARERAANVERAATEESQRFRAQQLEQATQDARAIVEAARERGREMVAEARALRERVISDLNRRRDMLRNYIEQVRSDRDRFVDTYRAVREAVTDARDELARFESEQPFADVPVDAGPIPALSPEPSVPEGAPKPPRPEPRRREPAVATGIGLGELPGRPAPVPPLAPQSRPPRPAPSRPPRTVSEPEPGPGATEPEPERAQPKPAAEPEPEPEAAEAEPQPEAAEPEPEAAEAEPEPEPERAPAEPEPEATAAPRLDLEPEPAIASAPARQPEPEAPPEAASRPGGDVEALFERIRASREQQAAAVVGDGGTKRGPQAAFAAPGPAVEPEPVPEGADAEDAELLRRRDELLEPVARDLVRRCKRVLQNEQNVVLDALRRQRRRVTPETLLPPLDEQLAEWTEIMTPAIDEAYVAARAAVAASQDSPVFRAPQRIVSGLVEVVVAPLRERLLAAIEGTLADDPDTEPDVLAQRIGARYREWKGQELDGRIGDVLAAAYARGVYDAAPDGVRLRWIPAEKGQCPDADDNALEPTRRGERFPTGQQFPPAHPGCRCLLAVVHEHRSWERNSDRS